MSFLKEFNNILNFVYPNTCIHCTHTLFASEKYICLKCDERLCIAPHQTFNYFDIYPMVINTYFMYSFSKMGVINSILHAIKYNSNRTLAEYMGIKMGDMFFKNKVHMSFDYILPMPMHALKKVKRGYNQCELMAYGLSNTIKIPLVPENKVLKNKYTDTQTKKTKIERFKDIQGSFTVTAPSFFMHKHILIIDDVLTTGATMESLLESLKNIEGLKVTVFVLAYNPLSE